MNCSNCKNNCCSAIPDLIPVLLPEEENVFYNDVHETKFYKLCTLKRINNVCFYFNEKEKDCSIYEHRPIECRIYPYLLDFSKNKIDFKLDNRFCHLKIDKPKLNLYLPEDWIKAYLQLSSKFNSGL